VSQQKGSSNGLAIKLYDDDSGLLWPLAENISEQGFNTWFGETEVINLIDSKLSVKVPTQFIADYLNSNYSELVSEICFNLFNNKYNIRFTGINLCNQGMGVGRA
jgi:chromosomal replication initiation ATPase DnaA